MLNQEGAGVDDPSEEDAEFQQMERQLKEVENGL
jgi:hypothetical protein